MKINRFYTKHLQKDFQIDWEKPWESRVWDLIEWDKRTSKIINPDGSVVFLMENVEVPKHWSQVAVDILAQKYFRKAGVPLFTKPYREENVPEWLQ
ncbi:MAG: hypothetical protein ACK42K_07300, partial [Leptonema sp. (in: bacteria)]